METLEKLEIAVDDLAKGLASRKEVIDEIDKTVKEEKEKAEALASTQTELTATIDQLKTQADELVKQIKAFSRIRVPSENNWPAGYRSVWSSPDQAKRFGLFILASVLNRPKSIKALEDYGIEMQWIQGEKAMGEGTITGGGAVVPTEFFPNLLALQETYGVFRRNVNVWPMASDSGIAPKLSEGLTVYCPGEGKAITASDLTLGTVGLTAKMWATLTAISTQLDEDAAIAIGELVGRQIVRAFAKKEDEIGFLGDGTSTYFGHRGITGALRDVDATIANIKSLVVAAGNAYSEITLANFDTVAGTLPDYADDGDAKWFPHRLFYYTVMVRLALAAGGANATEIIQGRGVREKTFLSYPVEFSAAMPKTEANSQICTIFGNLRMGALLGDRRQLTIDSDKSVYFANVQIGVRGTQRVAITVHGVGDTTDAGPICGLITAAS